MFTLALDWCEVVEIGVYCSKPAYIAPHLNSATAMQKTFITTASFLVETDTGRTQIDKRAAGFGKELALSLFLTGCVPNGSHAQTLQHMHG